MGLITHLQALQRILRRGTGAGVDGVESDGLLGNLANMFVSNSEPSPSAGDSIVGVLREVNILTITTYS